MIWILYILGWYAIGVISTFIGCFVISIIDGMGMDKEDFYNLVNGSLRMGVLGPICIFIMLACSF